MSILERLKNFFKGNKQKALPEGQFDQPVYNNANYNSFNSNRKVLTRQDGSKLEIEPILDSTGNQTYESVFNEKTHQFQAIPKYKIMSEELKQIVNPDLLNHTVLIDIDPSLLQNPNVCDFIANSLLSAKRMEKVVNEYGNYAGTFELNSQGKFEKKIDLGIINTLNDTKANNARKVEEDRMRREQQQKEDILRNAQNKKVNIKTSHAEDLSGQKWPGEDWNR